MNINEFKEPTQRYACLVNRTVVIDTLERKANITNYKYIRPKRIKTDLIEKRNRKGKFLYYEQKIPVEIKDVDGKIKETVKTFYYQQDKIAKCKNPEIGIYDGKLGGKYHGRKSCNWKQEYLTLQEIIDALNSGYAIAPGEFQPPEGESRRSGEYCMSRQFILFDADEWTSEHYGLKNIDELIERYPDITKDFYWIGESISSRSSLKPELRCRLMLVLPQPIKKDEDILWETAIDNIVEKYSFIPRCVSIDKVRLSFGNARLDCDNRILNGIISQESFDTWKQKASEKSEQVEKVKQELAEQKQHQAEKRQRDNTIRTELKKRGYPITDQITDPIAEFCKVDPATLLTKYDIATHLQGNEWHYTSSGAGRSLVLENGKINPFSNSAQTASPADNPTSPVNAHRYILNCLFQLDMSNQSEKQQLKCKLATMGYGTHPDDYKKKKREEMVYAVREGLESPLSLRPAAPSLPTKQERIDQSLSTLHENAKEIARAFTEQNRIIAVQAGTGEGKTEKAIAYAIHGGKLFMTLNSIPLAEQVYQRFAKVETKVFLWRSRSKGYTDSIKNAPRTERIKLFQEGDILCIKPEMINAAESKGLQPRTAICHQCEVKNECTEYGYLSQKNKARETQVLCVAMPKAFTDPASEQFYNDLTINKSDELINVIDEAKIHDLFITCELSKKQLQEWQVFWKGERLAEFAKQVLTKIEIENDPYAVAEIVSRLTDTEIEKLSYQACRYNIAYEKIDKCATCEDTNKPLANHSLLFDNQITAYVALDTDSYDILLNQKQPAVPPIEIKEKGFIALTPEQCFKIGVFNTDTIQDINALPSIYRRPDWTPFQQLKIFAERYKRKCDAPIEYSNNMLTWIIPPRIQPKIKKLICMSATLNEDLFYRTFDKDKTKFIKTAPTPHVEGAKAYQIRTGAYPRRSLLEYSKESDYKDVIGLSKTGKNFLHAIETEIKRDKNKKHVIITFNKIIEFESERLTETHPNLLGTHSFHKMEGLDYTEPNITFWILGTPDVSKNVVVQRAKLFYGNDTEKLNYDKDPDTRKYTDPRVQLCWENEVTARLIQAVGRGRLNRLANTVILFSNVLIPNFTNKAIGFVIEDLEVAGSLDNLTKTARARLTYENDIRTADNPNAHQQTRETREKKRQKQRELKASRKNRALKMYLAGKTPTQISEEFGVHTNTVRNWIKKEEINATSKR